jgi:hypothetical protein
MDVLNAGSGNDTITINASNITALAQTNVGNRARVDGGGNIDTLTLDGSGRVIACTSNEYFIITGACEDIGIFIAEMINGIS